MDNNFKGMASGDGDDRVMHEAAAAPGVARKAWRTPLCQTLEAGRAEDNGDTSTDNNALGS